MINISTFFTNIQKPCLENNLREKASQTFFMSSINKHNLVSRAFCDENNKLICWRCLLPNILAHLSERAASVLF